MRSVAVLLVIVAACVALGAPPARAQGGGGLYEPFPEPAGKRVVRDFLERLPGGSGELVDRMTDEDLERGSFVPGVGGVDSSAQRPASARAGASGDPAVTSGWVLAFAAAAAAGAAALLVRRR
jgi:hypothetical protein